MGSRAVILAYHGIRPAGEPPAGERVLHLEEGRFREQLEVLGELARVVPLESILDEDSPGDPRPRVAITWDDAYAGALAVGLEELVSRGMPATFFVSPGRLGGQAFWWDLLAMRHHGEIPADLRERVLRDLSGDGEAVGRLIGDLPEPADLPPWARSGDDQAVLRAGVRPGIRLASHSWSHANLSVVDPARLKEELVRALRWLSERAQGFLPWLALPYGLGTPDVSRQARSSGYGAVLGIRGGWLPAGPDRTLLPRLNVPAGLSTDGFALRLRGLFCR